MATATAKKPTAPKLTAKAPGAKPAAKGAVAKAKPAAAPKPPKEEKPFDQGLIVTFKGYSKEPPEGTVKVEEGAELAVVSQRVEDGQTFVACVRPEDYHKYMANPDAVEGSPEAVDGAEYTPSELRRTNKFVEEPFALVAVGEYARLSEETPDPLERGQLLFSRAQESFFYLGGTLSELWHGKAEDEVTPIFCAYNRPEGAATPDDATALDDEGGYANNSQGFALFIEDYFPTIGGIRKVKEFIGIYTTFSVLPNAAEIIKRLPEAGWWKAGMIRTSITEDNAAELVQEAIDNTVPQLQAVLRTKYVTEDGKSAAGKTVARVSIKKSSYQFQLYEDQGTGVTMILDTAAKMLNIADPNALFEHIVTEWAGDHLGAEAVNKAKAAADKATEALRKNKVKFPEGHPAAAKQAAEEAPAAAAPAPTPAAPTRRLPARKPAPAAAPAA